MLKCLGQRRAWLVAFGLAACARSPSAVSGPQEQPGTKRYEPKKDQTADEALAKAAGLEQESPRQGYEAYVAVYREYPQTTAAQEALYRAGLIAFQQREYASARKALNQLLFENPLFDKSKDAKLKLGLSALELRLYRDAYQTLSSLVPSATGEERTKLLQETAKAAEGAQLNAEALRAAVDLLAEAKSDEDRNAGLQRVTEVVEERASFLDIAKVLENLPTSNPAWPILTFKLARIYYHLRDWPRLEETLRRFLREAPRHPLAAQAEELLTRARRRTEIHPKVIGAILPMSGRYKPLGEAVMRGVELALHGSDIQVVVKDSQGDPSLAGKAAEELVFDSGVIAILGPLWEDARRGALTAEELGVPILTLSRSEGITDIGPHVFRNMLTNSTQAKVLADYSVNTLGYKTFALLYPNIPYGVDLANKFWDEVTARGGEVRGAESYSYDQTTFTNEVKKLVGRYYLEDRIDYLEAARDIASHYTDPFRKRKALEKVRSQLLPIIDFDAIFIPDAWERVGLVAPALAVEDVVTNACDPKDLEKIRKTTGRKTLKTVTLLGSDQWSSHKGQSGVPELIERGGKFVSCSVYVDGFFADAGRPATRRFVEAYKAAYRDQTRPPGLLEATGYDSARMFRKIFEESPGALDREAFRSRLAWMKDFEGATGKTSFNDKREAERPLFLLGVEGQEIHELAPPPTSSPSGRGSG